MTSQSPKILPLQAEKGRYNVTKKTIDAYTGGTLSLEKTSVNQEWFDRMCDKDPDHFFITGSVGEEEAFWLREI